MDKNKFLALVVGIETQAVRRTFFNLNIRKELEREREREREREKALGAMHSNKANKTWLRAVGAIRPLKEVISLGVGVRVI
jgi:hypothetical protein